MDFTRARLEKVGGKCAHPDPKKSGKGAFSWARAEANVSKERRYWLNLA
jgi:hypothetical protein